MAENENKKNSTKQVSSNNSKKTTPKSKSNSKGVSNNKNKTASKTKSTNNKTKNRQIKNKETKLETKEKEKEIMIEDNKDEIVEEQNTDSKMNEKSRVLIVMIFLALCLSAIVGLLVMGQNDKNNKKSSSEIVEAASFDEFKEAWESDELSVIYFMSSECGYCEMESPILEQIATDYEFDYIKVDATQLNNNEISEIIKLLNIEGATPTTVIVQNEQVIATQQGYLDGHDYVNFFISGGILEEGAVYTPEQYLTFVDFDEYKELVDLKSLNIITIGQTACSYCAITRPILSEIANEYDIVINYLDLRRITQDEQSEFFEMLEDMEYDDDDFLENGSFGTPLTVITKNGKIVSYVNGAQEKSSFVSAFEKAEIIE